MQFRAVQVLGPARATAFQFLVPALTVVLAAIFLNEQIRLEQIVGGVVIVLGIVDRARAADPARPARRGEPRPTGA